MTRTRAIRGDGSVKQRKSGKLAGKWRVQWDYPDPDTDVRVYVDKSFPTQDEGVKYLRDLKAKVHTGQRIEAVKQKALTLGEFFEFLAESEWPNRLGDATIKARQGRYRKYWKDRWGHITLTKIDAMKVRAWYDELTASFGPSVAHTVKTDLVGVINKAKQPYGKFPAILANPFALTVKAPERRTAYSLNPQAVRAAIGRLEGKRRAIFALHALAALRFSEVRALTLGQIHWDANYILIDRAIRVEFNGHEFLGLPKSDKTRRVVLCSTLKAILRTVTEGLTADDYVFPAATMDNKWRTKKLSYSTWNAILKTAKLPDDLDTHDLRLSHINWIKQMCSDIDDVTLKLHVGHEAAGVTEVNYTRPLSEAERKLAAVIEREFGIATLGADTEDLCDTDSALEESTA
ncbi:MAG: site-specific integrase [Alphaproteobacteria bacterium]|nr:MAG: site-specific integrase [Alphaproteobacteria bacterium]